MYDDNDLLEKIKDAFESFTNKDISLSHPKEALPVGTFVSKSTKDGSLGVITDSFYGELDMDNQKIVIYTVIWLSWSRVSAYGKASSLTPKRYYVSNEYEYDVIGYLMIKPIDINSLIPKGGEMLL